MEIVKLKVAVYHLKEAAKVLGEIGFYEFGTIAINLLAEIEYLIKKGIRTMNIDIETIRNNFTYVEINDVEVYFSYKTPIAFNVNHTGVVIRENDWGTATKRSATGKHLNHVAELYGHDKKDRVSGAEFEKRLEALEL